jgi:hypothetical protein
MGSKNKKYDTLIVIELGKPTYEVRKIKDIRYLVSKNSV